MSYWGATVITNLLSAIPVVGNDLVQLAWGGFCVLSAPFYSNVTLQTLLTAGTTLNSRYYSKDLSVNKTIVKTLEAAKAANNSNSVIGLLAGVPLKYEGALQRLHAGDPIFAYLSGFIEGDGYIGASKKGKYIKYSSRSVVYKFTY